MSQSRTADAIEKSRPTTPRASRGAVRREEILTAAEDVFLERGYANTTMDDIAAYAKASKATIYKQFGSKEAMFAEIVRSRAPDIADASIVALRMEGPLETILVHWSLHVLNLVTAPRSVALFKLILAESSRSPELAQIFYEKGPGTVQQHLAEYFKRATAAGRMRCRDPKLASAIFVSAIFGDGFERALIGLADSDWYERKAKAHVKEAVAMFLSRYGA